MKTESATDWIGYSVVDREGANLGDLQAVLADDQTQKPEWAVVSSGLFGKTKPVPLADARPEGKRVIVNVTKDMVKSAPDVQDISHLTPDEEITLFKHYGLPFGGETVTAKSGRPTSGERKESGQDARGQRFESGQGVPLHEEELTAKKQTVQVGEARVGKEVVTEQKELEVPVMHEEPFIERQPVAKRPAESEIGEGEIRVPIMAEQASAEKRPVVKEEVKVGKRPVEETQHISESVRREEPRIDGDTISESER